MDINDFRKQRFAFLMEQIKWLNQAVHRYLLVFQAIITTIIGGMVAVFVSWRELTITAEQAVTGVQALAVLFTISDLFLIASMLATIRSWWDFRMEESELVNGVLGADTRKPPKLRNCWYWSETWLVALLVLAIPGVWVLANRMLVPMILR